MSESKPGSTDYRWTNNLIIISQAALLPFLTLQGPYTFIREDLGYVVDKKNVSVEPFNYLASECIPHQGQHPALLAKFWK